MKNTLSLILVSLSCLVSPAAEKLDATLQKGLFEEEANQNLDAAIQAYQSLVSAHDNDRKIAATAIYRLGECYRKLGRTNEAISQFQRILASFSDQATLVTLSRQNLAGLGSMDSPASAASTSVSGSLPRRQFQQQSLASARAEAAAATELHQKLQDLSTSELRRSLLTVVPDEPLSRLLEQAAQTEQKLANMRTQFSDQHPSVVAEMKTQATVEKQIDERMAGILRGLQLQADTAQKRVEMLEAESANEGTRAASNAVMDESSRAKMKEMLQQELQIAEKILAEEKKKVAAGTIAPGEDLRVERDVWGVKRQLLAVDGLTTAADRKQWREWLVKEIQLAEQAADLEKKKLAAGRSTVAVVAPLQRDLLALKRELLEFDSRRAPGPAAASTAIPTAITSEEEEEIRRIKLLISNSPDLINTPSLAFAPLHQAASKGQLIVARFLLDNGARLDLRTADPKSGDTALHLACAAGHKAMAELLLSRGADPNSPDKANESPLHIAAKKGFISVAEVLLRNKGQVDFKNSSGETPLHVAIDAGQSMMALALVQAEANVNATRVDGQTPLHRAAARGDIELTTQLLSKGARPDAIDKFQSTPLYLALTTLRDRNANAYQTSQYDGVGVIRLLLEKGASIERAPVASSMLHQAVACNSPEVVKLILERKPNVEAVNSRELTALQSAVVDGQSPELIPLLVKAGADVRRRIPSTSSAKSRQRNSGGELSVKGYPPLIVAIWRNDSAIAEALLENGADVNATIDRGSGSQNFATATMFALWTKSQEFLDLVLRYKPDLAAQTQDEGKTVLHFAVENSVSATATLLRAGAPVNAVDFRGRTPLHLAIGSYEMAELLLKNGADPNLMSSEGQRPLDMARARTASSGQVVFSSIQPGVSAPTRSIRQPGSLDSGAAATGPNEIENLLLKHGADELLLRQQSIRVTRRSRNFDVAYFRKGTNDFNRYTLFELLANVFGRRGSGNSLPFPDLRQLTIERLQPDRSTQSITVDLTALLQRDNPCTNDMWLEWGDRIEIPEEPHPLSAQWRGLEPELVGQVAQCLKRSITIISKNSTNLYDLRAVQNEAAPRLFDMESFRLYDVLRKSGSIGDQKYLPIRIYRKGSKGNEPFVINFNREPDVDLWLRNEDVIEVLGK